MTTQPKPQPHWLVAHVASKSSPDCIRFPVLDFCQQLYDLTEMAVGDAIDDHGLPYPDQKSGDSRGLFIWEGVCEMSHGPDPDVEWHGNWRRLTADELARLSRGEVVRE